MYFNAHNSSAMEPNYMAADGIGTQLDDESKTTH